MYWQTGSSSIKVILDNSVLVEPAQVVGNTGETTWCNLAHVFTLSQSGSNMMGISKQKLPNIYTYLDRAKKCTSLINSHLRKKIKAKAEADSQGLAEFIPGLTTAVFDNWVQNYAWTKAEPNLTDILFLLQLWWIVSFGEEAWVWHHISHYENYEIILII